MDPEYRASVAWHMLVADVILGHEALGFDYPMSGDARPERPMPT